LSGLAYVLGLVIVESVLFSLPVKGFTCLQIRILAAPIGNCDYIRRVSFLYAVAMPFTVLLLVFRVVALYMNNKYVIVFFALSWLSVLAISMAVPFGMTGMQIKNTAYCVEIKSKPHAILLSAIGPGIHDILIFMATIWALMKNSYTETNMKNSFNVMVLGRHLPAFSKSLLHNGQLYFL